MESAKLKIAAIVESLVAARVAGDRSSVVRHFRELAATPGVHDAINHQTLIDFTRLAESIVRGPDAKPELEQEFVAATNLLAAGSKGFWGSQAFLFGAAGVEPAAFAVPTGLLQELCAKLIRRGDIAAASQLLKRLDSASLRLHPVLWSMSAQIERLSCRSHDLIRSFAKETSLPSSCEWEQLLARVQTGNAGMPELIRSQAAGNPLRQASRMAAVSLWAWATSDRFGMTCPSQRAIRDQARKEAGESAHLSLTLCMIDELMAMAGAQDLGGREAATRLTALLDRSSELPSIEDEALVLAAAARVAAKSGAPLLGDMAALSYKTLSSRLSNGASADLWLVGEGRASDAPVMGERDFRWLAQTAQQVSSMGGLAKTALTAKLKRSMSVKSTNKGLQERDVIEMATQLREAVRTSKGALLKVAQILSFLDHVLPPLVAKELRAMEPDAIPLAGPLAVQIVETKLGRPLSAVFSEWSPYPMAAASIGQVHRARLKSGELVAVKVQYPHLDRYLAKQIRAIRYMVPAMKALFPGSDTARIVDEIADGLMDEINYPSEAERTFLFREAVKGIPGIRVPNVYTELSGPGLLTLEFLEGVHLRDFAKTASQADRNRAAEAIFSGVMTPRQRHGFINKDPHPGNFLFTEDTVGYIDFGATVIDTKLVADYSTAYRLVRDGKRSQLIEFLISIGFVARRDDADLNLVAQNYESGIAILTQDRVVRFDGDVVRQDFTGIQHIARMIDLPPGWFGLLRGILGLNWVMVGLGAEVNLHRILDPLCSTSVKPATDRLAG